MTVSKGSSGRTIVKFVLKNPLANPPAGFAIATPPRIALDFPDTANGLGATQRNVEDVALRSVNVVQAGNRTRVVFNLNRPQTFETQLEGNAVLVTLIDQGDQLDAKAQTVQRFAESRPGDTQHALRDVDFRRGTNGEGRIVVDLSDPATGIDIRQQGKTLIVDFIKTSLPRNLERRLDVQDFGTPIVTVDTFAQGPNVRMIVEPKGLWEHSAYQTDNRFILEVKPIVEDPNKLVQGTRQGYKGEKLSLNFQNVEVRAVLQVIADFTGLNIITSDSVSGSLTLRLKDIPWDQALDIIMQTKGLDMRKNGNVVLIAPREELALKEKQQLEAQKDISELEPLVSESFQLNYIKAQDLLNLITTQPAAAVRPRRGPDRDDRRPGLVHLETRGRDGRPAVEHPVRAGHPVQPRGDPQDHPADRHADPAGGDRGAHRDRQRQVRPPARRALRRPDGIPDQQQVCGGAGRQPQHAAGRRDARGHGSTRDTRTQTPYELASGITYAGLLGFAAAQRQPAGAQRRRQSRADADQPGQRQPHQPRAVGAGIRQSRQGGFEPARGHRRQPEGARSSRAPRSPTSRRGARTTRPPCSSRRRCCGST